MRCQYKLMNCNDVGADHQVQVGELLHHQHLKGGDAVEDRRLEACTNHFIFNGSRGHHVGFFARLYQVFQLKEVLLLVFSSSCLDCVVQKDVLLLAPTIDSL